MAGINRVTILGRLGKNPELKYTPSGVAVATFSVATSKSWQDKAGQKQEKTQWHNIVVWNKLAEIANQYLQKGSQVYLEGEIETRTYEKDGDKRYITEIVANKVEFVGGKPNNAANADDTPSNTQAHAHTSNAASEYVADDIPF